MSLTATFGPYIIGTAAAVLAFGYLRRQRASSSLPLPPGPKRLPVIGNLLDLPKEFEWLTYQQWTDAFGDVIYVEALGQKLVILGSAQAVDDLLERRSAIYSDRIVTPMIDMMGWVWSLALQEYGEAWRQKRKLMHAHVHQGVVDRYQPVQIASARRLARDVLAADNTPEVLGQLVRLNFGQTIIKVAYGIEVDSYESPYIQLPEKALAGLGEAIVPGRFLVDLIPALRHLPTWFPGAGFKRFAIDNRKTHEQMRNNAINTVKAQMVEGTAPPSMARTMLEDDALLPPAKSQIDMIKDVAGVAYVAGSDTTVAAVVSFFLAMLVYPDVQAKAQAEVDRVVGKDRLPEPEDRKEMPYIEGIVNECLRWLPVQPLALPHKTTQDDTYKGYFIPKGAVVMGSAWSMMRNADDYPEPERFNPERYLNADGEIDSKVRDPRTAVFGYGRRICPGRFFADTSLFLSVATLLATVDVVRAKDARGNEIVPVVDSTGGALSHPKPFPWAVRPRSAQATELLASSKGKFDMSE